MSRYKLKKVVIDANLFLVLILGLRAIKISHLMNCFSNQSIVKKIRDAKIINIKIDYFTSM